MANLNDWCDETREAVQTPLRQEIERLRTENAELKTLDGVIAVLLAKQTEQTREDWQRVAAQRCEEWGTIVLYWAQEEVHKVKAENAELREAEQFYRRAYHETRRKHWQVRAENKDLTRRLDILREIYETADRTDSGGIDIHERKIAEILGMKTEAGK